MGVDMLRFYRRQSYCSDVALNRIDWLRPAMGWPVIIYMHPMDAQTKYTKARAAEKKLSRNRRKRAIAALGVWLHQNHPRIFHPIKPPPLARGIEHEIYAQTEGQVSLHTIRSFLYGWVNRKAYLEAIIAHKFRVHLNGSGSEFIGRKQQRLAAVQLKALLFREKDHSRTKIGTR